ncbi:cupin domain-containing protein [Spirosoma sp. HMF4905]|uniref:Cupin domain-containing protein n=1 Tax=Spirosoma arboris TaxID=2682092 RepID=A0A7K1SPU3_9BACT|nr:cupin domain-containing protein [Spirosoma arboris]MVM35832.1 cupin domain-containing protein [Spirosoma arboris]
MQFNEQEYIKSGRLEQYALGILSAAEAGEVKRLANKYPSIRAELDWAMKTLADSELAEPVIPRPGLKSQIMKALGVLDEAFAFDLNALPLINTSSDASQWERTVASIQPPANYKNLFGHVLRKDAKIEQILLWVRQSVRPEEHHDELESFLILEGRCECSIGGELVQLSAGDYMAVPIDLEHTVRVISDTPVKAIVQRIKIDA